MLLVERRREEEEAILKRVYGQQRILVTGGAGFLGCNLIDRLLEHDDEVLCVDNLFTGDKRQQRFARPHPAQEL